MGPGADSGERSPGRAGLPGGRSPHPECECCEAEAPTAHHRPARTSGCPSASGAVAMETGRRLRKRVGRE